MERGRGCQHADGFEQIGFALGIVAVENKETWPQSEVKLWVVAKLI
jgi:hypothetical protein